MGVQMSSRSSSNWVRNWGRMELKLRSKWASTGRRIELHPNRHRKSLHHRPKAAKPPRYPPKLLKERTKFYITFYIISEKPLSGLKLLRTMATPFQHRSPKPFRLEFGLSYLILEDSSFASCYTQRVWRQCGLLQASQESLVPSWRVKSNGHLIGVV